MTLFMGIVLTFCWKAQASESAEQVFAKRRSLGLDAVEALLRERLSSDPGETLSRYFLASTLLEKKGELSQMIEALKLLNGLERESEPAWLAAWSLARRMEAAVQIQQLNRTQGAMLPESARALTGGSEFQAFLSQQLLTLDAALGPMREGLQRAKALKRAAFTGDEVRADLLQLHDLLRSHWAYEAEKKQQTGVGLSQLLTRFQNEIQAQMSRQEANDLLLRFVASLEDGHTFLSSDTNAPQHRLPFRAVDTKDGVVIAEAADHLPLRKGDRLLEIKGMPIEQAIGSLGALACVSTSAARRAHAIDRLSVFESGKTKLQLKIERDGQQKTVDLPPHTGETSKWINEVELGPWVRSRLIRPEVGHLRVVTWAPLTANPEALSQGPEQRIAFFRPLMRDIDAALAALKACSSIIIDVRGNGGGYDDLACYLASYFVASRPIQPYVLRYRAPLGEDGKFPPGADADGYFNKERMPATYLAQDGPVWKTRLYILVDEHCFSATDTFLNVLTQFAEAGQVMTMGRASAGGIGGPKPLGRLRNTGALLTASSCKAYSTTGVLLEGKPARLDVPILWSRADILSSRDPDLEEAIRRAKTSP